MKDETKDLNILYNSKGKIDLAFGVPVQNGINVIPADRVKEVTESAYYKALVKEDRIVELDGSNAAPKDDQVKNLESKIVELEGEIKEHKAGEMPNAKLDKALEKLETLKTANKTLQADVKAKEDEILKLNSDTSKDEVKALTDKVKSLTSDLKDKVKELAGSVETVEKARGIIEEKDIEIGLLNDELKKAE